MGSVSGRQKRRLYDPEAERERWRHLFFMELMERPAAQKAYDRQIRSLHESLTCSLFPDYAEQYVNSSLYDALAGRGDPDSAGYRLLAQIERFSRETIRCTQNGVMPGWVFDYVEATISYGFVPSRPVHSYRRSPDPSRRDPPVRIPSSPGEPVPVRPDWRTDRFWRYRIADPLSGSPVIAETLSLRYTEGEDFAEWRKQQHTALDRIMDRMQTKAENTYHHMNPSTEARWKKDAANLAALCVDRWQPIGEDGKKRLTRFADFVGIDYPGQKLAGKAA